MGSTVTLNQYATSSRCSSKSCKASAPQVLTVPFLYDTMLGIYNCDQERIIWFIYERLPTLAALLYSVGPGQWVTLLDSEISIIDVAEKYRLALSADTRSEVGERYRA